MNGVGGGNFDPEGTVNRAMLVTVLWRMENSPSGNARAPFGDVASGQWYTTAIDWAYQNRIVNGTSPTTFAPAATLTREQAMAMQKVGVDTVYLTVGESIVKVITNAMVDIHDFVSFDCEALGINEKVRFSVLREMLENIEDEEALKAEIEAVKADDPTKKASEE